MDDLDRNVWCLLGLPFDAVTMDETIEKIHHSVRTREKCFISTPNLNFLIASQKDNEFRDSVINSDLSVADGKPIIWMARILDIPLSERVAGSDIIERLIENKEAHKPIKVFFFGGQEGIAEQACKKLNAQDKGLHCAGFYSPGFGSVDEMSTPEIIDTINQSGADFVIVSLGAIKGQAWIQLNKDKLEAPVISHLGAVVNFVAGNVNRAPKLLQKLGMEWMWRIKEEPSLWRRYFYDGLALLRLLMLRVIPYRLLLTANKNIKDKPTNILVDNNTIKVSGIACKTCLNKIHSKLNETNIKSDAITIDLNDVDYMDSAFLGFLLTLKGQQGIVKNIIIKSNSKFLNRILYYNGLESNVG